MDQATAEKPPFHSIEATVDRYSSVVSLRKPDGTAGPVSDLIKALDISENHIKYKEINSAVQQVAAAAEVMGVMEGALPVSPPGENILPKMTDAQFHEFARRRNNWPNSKKITIGYNDFADVLATHLEQAGIEDVAQKARALSGTSPNSSGS